MASTMFCHSSDRLTPLRAVLRTMLVLLCAVASLSGLATAQTPGALSTELQMQVQVGLGDRFRAGFWTPVTVYLANEGVPVDGTLSIVVRHGNPFQTLPFTTAYEEPVHLSQGSRLIVQIPILLSDITHPLRVEFNGPDGTELLSQVVDLRSRATGAHVVVALAPDGHGWGWLQKQLGTGLTLRGQRIGLEVVYVRRAAELPTDWSGYHGVTAVAVSGDFPLHMLTPQQQAALRTWVEAGGTLIFAGGPRTEAARSEIAAALAPLTLSGAIRAVEALQLGVAYPSLPEAVRLVAWDATMRAGAEAVARATDGTPLVARRAVGAGEAFLIAFDPNAPELAHWEGHGDLARDALRSAQTVGATLPPAFEQAAWDFIESGRISHAGRTWPALFLAGYVLCISLCLQIARRRQAGFLGAVFVVGAFMAVAVWLIGPQAEIAQRGVVEVEVTLAGRQGAATNWSYFGLASLPIGPWSSESAQPAFARHAGFDPFDTNTGPNITLSSHGGQLVITGLAEGQFERFRQASIDRFPLWADLSTVGLEYRLTVVNDTGEHLESVYYVTDSQHLYLGEIGPGETVETVFSGRRQSATQVTPEWVGNAVAGDLRNRLGPAASRTSALLGSLVKGYLSAATPVAGTDVVPGSYLVGFVRSAPKTQFEPQLAHERVHLFLGTLNTRPAN